MRCNGQGIGMACCNEPGVREFCTGFCGVWWMNFSYYDVQQGTIVSNTFECCACNEFCLE